MRWGEGNRGGVGRRRKERREGERNGVEREEGGSNDRRAIWE